MDEMDADLKAFFDETFYKSEPIRGKSVRAEGPLVEKVWIKDFKIDENGVKIKRKQIKNNLNNRFSQLQAMSEQMGLEFDEEDDDEDEDQYEDINTDENIDSNGMTHNKNDRKILLSLANKLKKKSICNRLGMAYTPGKNRLNSSRTRLGTSKSWSEKFGRLLAAKKLLYLPLLYRKYKSGPIKTRQELDIEIDLYMAEVKKAKNNKYKLAFEDITNAANNGSDTNNNVNNGITVLDHNRMFGGFGGPKWRKRLQSSKPREVKDKESLDMEIDDYMQNKDESLICVKTEIYDKEQLDVDLDQYMAQVNKNKSVKTEVITNGFH